MTSVRVPAYAKINLWLDVLGRRADGYHEVRTVFQTISLHDTLELETTQRRGVELRIGGNAALAAEPGRDNLVTRALEVAARELRLRGGVRATLRKRIPVGRGLGGGSSDAAAALLGLMRLARKRMAPARLVEIASNLGADVPFLKRHVRAEV